MTLLLIRISVWGNVAPITALPALAIVCAIRAVENALDTAIRQTPDRGAVAAWLQQRPSGMVFTISGKGIR